MHRNKCWRYGMSMQMKKLLFILTHNRYCKTSWLINNSSKNKNNSPRHLNIVQSSLFPLHTTGNSEDVYSAYISYRLAQVVMQVACYLLCLHTYMLKGWGHSSYYIYKKTLQPKCGLIWGFLPSHIFLKLLYYFVLTITGSILSHYWDD